MWTHIPSTSSCLDTHHVMIYSIICYKMLCAFFKGSYIMLDVEVGCNVRLDAGSECVNSSVFELNTEQVKTLRQQAEDEMIFPELVM